MAEQGGIRSMLRWWMGGAGGFEVVAVDAILCLGGEARAQLAMSGGGRPELEMAGDGRPEISMEIEVYACPKS